MMLSKIFLITRISEVIATVFVLLYIYELGDLVSNVYLYHGTEQRMKEHMKRWRKKDHSYKGYHRVT